MQQIADWLQKLGLGQYAHRFAENDISFSILPDLTDQHLEKIGVASLGHRLQLLRAIAELTSREKEAPKPAGPTTAAIAAPTVTPSAEATGERRHVTVMFCDLADSTSISSKLDAEEWRDLVGAYPRCCLGSSDGYGRQDRQEARRWIDGTVRLSDRPGERCRAGGTGGALDPARARRVEPQERSGGQARTWPHASPSTLARRCSMRAARFSAM